MCGIVGAVAQRNVAPILLEGLRRLEYRGYDSAGLAVVGERGLECLRAVGKVQELANRLQAHPLRGGLGIAHTRWATHGGVTERNAHPQLSNDRVAVVHNGIIENFEPLRAELAQAGYRFVSDTDTEVLAHLIHQELAAGDSLLSAVRRAVERCTGAYALAVIDAASPDRLILARSGSPLVIGMGIGENFAASDIAALLPVTQKFIYLEEGDIAEVTGDGIRVLDASGSECRRRAHEVAVDKDAVDRGSYRHFMQKEIFEQPQALLQTILGRATREHVLMESLGPQAAAVFAAVQGVHIVACGTSYHAGLVAKYWIESMARLPCQVELASEYRYRSPVVPRDTLMVTLSQSGETADTLAALRHARGAGYRALLTVCNSAQSTMVRESDLTLLTQAGPEIGVASTKAFTTQLVSMILLSLMLGRAHGTLGEEEKALVTAVYSAPARVEEVLRMDARIRLLAERFVEKQHMLFLGRGPMYPIAMEGALKLKEISYIHAEAYAAGELKHGPLALIDEEMPVVVVAPNDELLDKLKSNMQVVRARGGELIVFADRATGIVSGDQVTVLDMPHGHELIDPILYSVPLQLLAYHVAVLKGTDVDQPRNLAKSVTVE